MKNCKDCEEPDKGLFGQCPGNLGIGCVGDWRCCSEMSKVCTGCKDCKDPEYCEHTECPKMKEFRINSDNL